MTYKTRNKIQISSNVFPGSHQSLSQQPLQKLREIAYKHTKESINILSMLEKCIVFDKY